MHDFISIKATNDFPAMNKKAIATATYCQKIGFKWRVLSSKGFYLCTYVNELFPLSGTILMDFFDYYYQD